MGHAIQEFASMNFDFTEEQTMLRSVVTRFLGDTYSFDQRNRRLADHSGFDAGFWKALADDLGLLGALLPQEFGGLGGGSTEVMLIMEAFGEALVVEPFLETTVLGGGLLKAIRGARSDDLLSGIVTGDVRLAVAAGEVGGGFVLNDVATSARRTDGGWQLNGTKPVVAAAPSATHLLVVARTSGDRYWQDGLSLFAVPVDAQGIEMHCYRLIDDRPAADITFHDVALPADALLGKEGSLYPILDEVMVSIDLSDIHFS